MRVREEADYYPEISFTKEVAKDRMKDVEGFIKTAGQYLSTQSLS